MRIKIINPNTNQEMTRSIETSARRYKRQDTEIVTVSPEFGPEAIDNFYDEALSSVGVLSEIKKGLAEKFDGFIIACFSDPALQAGREISEVPVVGIGEAAMLIACTVAHKFSIVSMPKSAQAGLQELVARYGLSSRCASVRLVDVSVSILEKTFADTAKSLLAESRRAIKEDGAEAIILGCAGVGALDKEFETQLEVPTIDGVVAAVKLVESIHDYGLKTSKVLTYRTPQNKKITGLPTIF